ncbi:phage tail tape measure protein [Bacillus atrophaeus]|uniref:phage tail tape measure protein n=1 Tax=Bacillus atrophaeus TaxID=1452 RepID=UPI002E1E369D|nr:phage tail tape measure protein [Bacillus atrophaeus]
MADQSILVRIGADISNLTEGLRRSQSSLSDFGSQLQSMGQSIALGFGAIAAGVGAGLGSAVNKAMDFEAQMSNVKAVSGATGDTMEKLTDLAIDMGAKTKFSSLEAGQGIEELIKAGVSLEDIMSGGLAGALDLAVAGELDLGEAAEIASTALNAFKKDGLSVTQAANMLAGAANASATDVHELKYGLSMVSAVASGVGLSFKDTSTALAIFAQNGLKGSDAGTSLKTMLLNLTPSSDAAYGTMEELGLITKDGANAFYDAEGNVKSFAEMSQVLQDKLGGLTSQQQQVALKTMFGTDAIRAANIMMKEGAKGANAMWKEMSKVTAAEVAAEKMNNLRGKIEELSGAFETAQISVGNALIPALSKLVGLAQYLVDGFNKLSPGMQKFVAYTAAAVVVFAGLGAVFGVFLIFIGSVISAVGTMITAFGTVAAAFELTSGALLLLLGQFALIAGAVIAAVAAIAILIKNNEAIRSKFAELADTIGSKLAPAITTLKTLFSGLATVLTGDFASGADKLREILPESAVQLIITGATAIQNAISNLINAVNLAFQGDFSAIAKYIPTIIGLLVGGLPGLIITGARFLPAIEQGIQQYLPTFLNGFVNIITSIINAIVTYLPMLAQAGVQIITGLLTGLTQALPNILTAITTVISTLIQSITTLLPMLLGAGILILTSLIQGIVSALPLIITAATQLLTMLITTIVTLLPMIIEAGIQILNALINGIIQVLPQLLEAALQLIMALIDAIVTNLPLILEAGIQILTALVDGIITMLPQLIEMALYLIVSLVQALINNLPKIIDAGVRLIIALVNGLIKALPQLVSAAITLLTKLVDTIIKFMPQLVDLGIKLLVALVKGLAQAVPKLLQMGVKIVTDLAGAIGDNVSKVFDAGVDLIKGLWNGINSVKDWILGKIGDFAGSITDGIKGFFGIHSPSRVFRDEVGKFLPLGLAVGIERNIGAVQSAANAMANAAMIDAQDYAYNPNLALTGGKMAKVKHAFEASVTKPSEGQALQIELVTVMDSEEIGRRTERVVSAEQGRKISIKNLMQG